MLLDRLFKKGYPRLDWIQVEISSLCNCRCIYCPHTEYRANWQNRLLPAELYRNLIPAFQRTKLVYLQGWGEPFTHPDFFDFLRLAKKAGCMVGTTTNGTMLNSEKIRKLIDEGLDIICFSLAGIDEKNDFIREGTQITKVLKCIEEIHAIRNNRSIDNPRIHLAYMLLRSGLDDIEKIPAFSENAGISETVISSLSLNVNQDIEKESVLASSYEEYQELVDRFHRITKESKSLNTKISFHVVSPLMEESYCTENVGRALVVGSDGRVSPCVMSQIPAEGDNFYYFRGSRQKLGKLLFGNIADETLNIIWNKKEYKKFIRTLTRGGIFPFCQNCLKRFILDLQAIPLLRVLMDFPNL
jgi:MoaA/NifB/PqqE/SkfB family radical SAM enzyme